MATEYKTTKEDKSVNVLENLLAFIRRLKILFIFLAIALLLAFISILLYDRDYVSTAKIIHKYSKSDNTNLNPTSTRMQSDQEIMPNEYSQIQGNRIINFGLPQHVISEIAGSNRFLLSVAKDQTIPVSSDSSVNYIQYLESQKKDKSILSYIKEYTIGLPKKLIKFLKNMITPKPPTGYPGTAVYLTPAEKSAIVKLSKIISVDINSPKNQDYQTITFRIKTDSPSLSVAICNSAIQKMQQELETITTNKEKENLDFIRSKFWQVQRQLENAEQQLVKFMDRNLDPQDARLKVEVERLKRKVNFISLLYQDLQNQKTQIELNLQKARPLFSVINDPQPGIKESIPVTKTLIRYFVLGFGLAMITILFNINYQHLKENEESCKRIELIQKELKRYHLYWDKDTFNNLFERGKKPTKD